MVRLLLVFLAALTFLLFIKLFSFNPAHPKDSTPPNLFTPWEFIPSSHLGHLANPNPKTLLPTQIQRYWRALFVGDFHKLAPKLKGSIKILQLQHLFTPSGMHFWPIQYFLLFFEFLILSLIHVPFPYLLHTEKRSQLAQYFFIIPRIIFYLFPQFIQGLHALKRMGLFYLARIFVPRKYSSFSIFFILSTLDLALGLLFHRPFFLISSVSSSPLSFFYTFIFLGSLLCSPGNFLSGLYFISLAHIFLACLWETPVTSLSLIATPILAGQITFLFALLLLQWIFLPFQWIHQLWLKLCIAMTEAQIKQIHYLGDFYFKKLPTQFDVFKWIEPSWPLLVALISVFGFFMEHENSRKIFRRIILICFFLHPPDLINLDRKTWCYWKNQSMINLFQTRSLLSPAHQSRVWEKKLEKLQKPKDEFFPNDCQAIPLDGQWITQCQRFKKKRG